MPQPVLVIVVVVLLVLAFAGGPWLGYAPAHWGYYPTGGLGLVVLILVVLLLLGRL
jgi:hypothetical protein